ncbi:hypothetical protein [Nitrosomonas sp.]|nr:hypothetical protein [Nitrosomonas sp.]
MSVVFQDQVPACGNGIQARVMLVIAIQSDILRLSCYNLRVTQKQ